MCLEVVWAGVVHASAASRAGAGQLLAYIIYYINSDVISTKVVPALITLTSDPDTLVKMSIIPAFGVLLQHTTQRNVLDKLYLQLHSLFDDSLHRGVYDVILQLIHTLSHALTNIETAFRENFVLPRFAMLADHSNKMTDVDVKRKVCAALLDGYNVVMCCTISKHVIMGAVLPGVRCLLSDIEVISPESTPTVQGIISELESKLASRPPQPTSGMTRSASVLSPSSPTLTTSSSSVSIATVSDDVRSTVSKLFKPRSASITKLFKPK